MCWDSVRGAHTVRKFPQNWPLQKPLEGHFRSECVLSGMRICNFSLVFNANIKNNMKSVQYRGGGGGEGTAAYTSP